MKPNRLMELDVLRTIAIVSIVICHAMEDIPMFANSALAMTVHVGFSVFGLSLFFFASGYSLMIKKPSFNDFNDMKNFIVKRITRIYPLYWFALMVAEIVLTFGFHVKGLFILTDYSIVQQLAIISGLQILFVPQLFSSGLGLFWFVSAIMLYYLLFPAILFVANKVKKSFTVSILVPALIVFASLVSLRTYLGFIAVDQVYIYYWIFIAGIVLGGGGITVSKVEEATELKVCLASSITLALLYAVKNNSLVIPRPMEVLFPSTVIMIIALALVGVISVLISILLVNRLKKIFNRPTVLQLVEKVGPETYSIYLFHCYFLAIFSYLASSLGTWVVLFFVVAVGIPCAIVFPIYIQKLFDYTLKIYTSRRGTGSSGPKA